MILIDAPHFCAAVVLTAGRVSRAAPILAYMTGWTADRVLSYARRKRWQTEVRP